MNAQPIKSFDLFTVLFARRGEERRDHGSLKRRFQPRRDRWKGNKARGHRSDRDEIHFRHG